MIAGTLGSEVHTLDSRAICLGLFALPDPVLVLMVQFIFVAWSGP